MPDNATAYHAAKPWLDDGDLRLYQGDSLEVLRSLPAGIAQTCCTSPPYWGLRSYLDDGHVDKHHELGLEPTPTEYIERIVAVFREVWRVLRDDGTLWVNLGDSYASNVGGGSDGSATKGGVAGHVPNAWGGGTQSPVQRPPGLKQKDLCGIPWKVAFALQADGWVLRSEIIWSKPNPMPESVTDRPTKAHEQVFLFSKARWVGAERPMPLRAEDAAWLAALIDGEGTICFQERENTHANHVGIRLSIVNTCTPLLERVREIVGIGGEGSPSPRHRSDGTNGRPIYTWQVTNAKAAAVIAAVRPYLIAKRTQADLALACHALNQKRRGNRQPLTTDAELDAKRRLASACSALNHGREVDLGWFTPPKPGRWVPNAYMYDADAVREAHSMSPGAESWRRVRDPEKNWGKATADGTFGHHDGDSNGSQAGRNLRSVWQIATEAFPEAHFATYPQALVERCIKAGTSYFGGCSECGAPWRRQVERQLVKHQRVLNPNPAAPRGALGNQGDNRAADGHIPAHYETETTGWKASCECYAPIKPQLVLDPFIGSGTTSLVARKHGRRSIGIDLSAEYLAIAAKRTQQLSLLGGAA